MFTKWIDVKCYLKDRIDSSGKPPSQVMKEAGLSTDSYYKLFESGRYSSPMRGSTVHGLASVLFLDVRYENGIPQFDELWLSSPSSFSLSFHKDGDQMGLCAFGFSDTEELKQFYYGGVEVIIESRQYEKDLAFQLRGWGDALSELIADMSVGSKKFYVTSRCHPDDSSVVLHRLEHEDVLYSKKP
jgi:hypothetical protein